MNLKLELHKEIMDYLSDMPEKGMGYQIVTITLKNGQVLTQRVVINSTYLLLNKDEQLQNEDIVSIFIEDKLTTKQ
ncbi:MAG: hypothetical protein ACOYOT_04715 [Bacteroidales bacterium]